MKKKILILGVGNAQVDAIRYCKESGYEVHGLSYKHEGAGIELVDRFEVINIVDKPAVAQYCLAQKIQAIYSVGSDIAMPTVGYVAQKMELPFLVSEKTAELLNNKVAFRNHLNSNKISELAFTEGASLEEFENWGTFPAILKPVDSQGQRGVYEINEKSDIQRYFSDSIKHSFTKKVILEEYIIGNEVSVNAFMYKNELKYSFISDRRVVKNLPGGIVKGHDFPTQMPISRQQEALKLVKESIQSLNIQNGPVYYQMKYTNKTVKIIEMTARLDGCHIWRLIKMNYGIDLLDLTFKTLMNDPVVFIEPKGDEKMKIEFTLEKPGSVFSLSNSRNSQTNSLFNEFYYKEGETVRAVNGHIEKTGILIIKE